MHAGSKKTIDMTRAAHQAKRSAMIHPSAAHRTFTCVNYERIPVTTFRKMCRMQKFGSRVRLEFVRRARL